MSERYTSLYRSANDLYAAGSPVVIAAGALLKDNQKGRVLAQLKLKSISEKELRAVTVRVTARDTFGKTLGTPVEHQYLDLKAVRDNMFGSKEAIPLPDSTAREFSAAVTEAAFADGSMWKADEDAVWASLPAQTPLTEIITDAELMKQYHKDVLSCAQYQLLETKDLWLCACGAVNHSGEGKCHHCQAALTALQGVDMEQLRADCDARLAEEARVREERAAQQRREAEEAAEQARREAEEAAAKAAAVKKLAIRIGSIAAAAAVVCIAAVLLVTKVIVPTSHYNKAVALMDSGDYEAAITAFEAMDGYKNSVEQIEACQTAIKDNDYAAAVALMESGDYEAAIAAFEAMDGYKDSADQVEQCSEIITQNKIAGFANASVGDTIVYGSYEQDNNFSNGQEDIEWIVLAKEGNQILVISKYALDCQQYNASRTGVTWETCSLRTWLNGTFLNEAFSSEEAAMIATTTVTADKNPNYSTNAGNNTQDQVFLLSITEVEKYFSSDSARQCEATAYAQAQGAYTSSSNGNCQWWVRSPGGHSAYAAGVDYDGSVYFVGYSVNRGNHCVHPALWINLGA